MLQADAVAEQSHVQGLPFNWVSLWQPGYLVLCQPCEITTMGSWVHQLMAHHLYVGDGSTLNNEKV